MVKLTLKTNPMKTEQEAKLREAAERIIRKSINDHLVRHVDVNKNDKRDRIDILVSESAEQLVKYWQEQNKPDLESTRLVVYSPIDNDFLEVDSFKEAEKVIKENYVEDGDIHPDIEGICIYKEVGFVSVEDLPNGNSKVEVKSYLTHPTESKESDWIDLPSKDLLKSGWWCLRIYQPKTKIEAFVMHEVTNGLHGYAYATHAKFMDTKFKNTKG